MTPPLVLSKLIDEAIDKLPAAQGVSWPIAVLGVARHDASEEEKNVLLGYLKRLRLIPGADGGAASIEIKLKDFWYFRLTRWEECYNEPINVIT
ncbi:hypothetical protein NQ176_g10278 [Zarea fungicola]|uniref:Uncharacterized protein n=1 Tax=Zarea fungicola TaxID=93591 RepID=A0ACC1MIR0_9HYPO|nr:hypothetical protein NQ176_g10278 [Lecanicillium fungicola]